MAEFTNEDDVTIEIPFDDNELDELAHALSNNTTYEFTAQTNTGREFKIVLMTEDEYDQRRK